MERLVPACLPTWATRPSPPEPFVLGVLPGEGIGPEIVGAALTVLDTVSEVFGITVDLRSAPELHPPGPYGQELADDMAEFFEATFAAGGPVFCGAVGGRFVYQLRARFDLYCKLVPVRPSSALLDASIVRPERLRDVDVLIVRDNIAGLYLGRFGRSPDGHTAYQELTYTTAQVDRILHVAARAATVRDGRLAVVTKRGGIPEVSALWNDRADMIAAEHRVALEHIDVDNACFQLVAQPERFDVVVASNMLGDIVADAAALVLGSRGMSYSANFTDDGRAVYQTGHGAAHDLTASDRANPAAQLLSLAMMLRESYGRSDAADAVERAIERVFADGFRTADVAGPHSTVVGTRDLAARIAEAVALAPAPAVVE